MMRLLGLTLAVSLACAPRQNAFTPRGDQLSTPVGVVSHHRSNVDVYLLCGDHDALELGVVPAGGFQAFEIPAPTRRFYPSVDSYVRLVVEKYAGLSTVSLQSN